MIHIEKEFYKSSRCCSSIAIVRELCFGPPRLLPSISAKTADSSVLNIELHCGLITITNYLSHNKAVYFILYKLL